MPPKDVGQKGVGGSTSSAAATEATKASSLAREGVQKLTMIVATTTPGAESKSRTKGELINLIMGLGATCHQETLSSHQQGLVLGQVVAQLTKNLNVSDPPATPQNPPGGGGGGTPQTVPAGGPMPTPPKPPPRFRWTAPAAGGGSRAGERDANALLTDSKTCAASPPPLPPGRCVVRPPAPHFPPHAPRDPYVRPPPLLSHPPHAPRDPYARPPFSRRNLPCLFFVLGPPAGATPVVVESWSTLLKARFGKETDKEALTTDDLAALLTAGAECIEERTQSSKEVCSPAPPLAVPRPLPCPARHSPFRLPSSHRVGILVGHPPHHVGTVAAPPPLTATDSSHRCPRHRAPPAGSRASPRR